MDRIASMPASQTRSVSYRIGEAASGGMGAISQPANQSESGPGQNEKVSQRAFLDCCTPESGRSFERGERQLRAMSGCEQSQQIALYSITSSARASSFAGTSRPSALA